MCFRRSAGWWTDKVFDAFALCDGVALPVLEKFALVGAAALCCHFSVSYTFNGTSYYYYVS